MNSVRSRASVAAALAEINMRYGCTARAAREDRRAPLTVTTLRTAELERIFRFRFGGVFPQSRDGLSALVVMAEHHIQRNSHEIVVRWVRSRAPWADATYAEGIAREAGQRISRQTAAALGWRIKLTLEERRRLRIRTIRAVGQTDDTMAEDRRIRELEAKEQQRRRAGIKPRDQWLAESKAHTKPWEAMGMSRSTWYRKGQPMPQDLHETGSSAIKREKIFIAEQPVSRCVSFFADERRKHFDRQRHEQKRRNEGCKTREQYEAESLSQTRPWERFGVSCRTWERRGKPIPTSQDMQPRSQGDAA